MAKNNNLTDFVTDLADTIRDKTGITGTINPQNFSTTISDAIDEVKEENEALTNQNQTLISENADLSGEVNIWRKRSGDFNVPDNFTVIPSYAFAGWDSGNITLSDRTTEIGAYAFKDCENLTSIVIPSKLLHLGRYAFENCYNLERINFNAPEMDMFGFFYPPFDNAGTSGDGITVIIGANVVQVPSQLFRPTSTSSAPKITSVEFEDGGVCEVIGRQAFYNCASLTSVEIPDSIIRIQESAFYGCTGLTGVYITDIAAWCNIVFQNDASNPLYYAHNLYLNNELVTELVIPDGITTISSYAFSGCEPLTSVVIPDSVTIIGASFKDCGSLTSVTIGNGVTSIDSEVFYNTPFYNNDANWDDQVLYIDNYLIAAKSTLSGTYTVKDGTRVIASSAFYDYSSDLRNVILPDSVAFINGNAFRDAQLHSMVIKALVPPTINKFSLDYNCLVYVPLESIDAYKTAEYWSGFATSQMYPYIETEAELSLINTTAYTKANVNGVEYTYDGTNWVEV